MTAPAHRVLTLVAGMLSVDRATAAAVTQVDGDAAPETESVGVNDPDRMARIAAIAAECGGEIAGG